MDRRTFQRALQIILEEYPAVDWSLGMDPFEVLVSVIISQNTTVANERRALGRLRRRVGLTPEAIVKTPLSELEDALRPAGLHRTKAPRIQGIAKRLLEGHNGDLTALLSNLETARDSLTSLYGIGPKTADVLLSVVAGAPEMPVDTHIWRIAKRWGITPGRNYDEVKAALEDLIPPDQRRFAHLSLIRFGRATCTARKPHCPICPIREDCPYYQKVRLQD